MHRAHRLVRMPENRENNQQITEAWGRQKKTTFLGLRVLVRHAEALH